MLNRAALHYRWWVALGARRMLPRWGALAILLVLALIGGLTGNAVPAAAAVPAWGVLVELLVRLRLDYLDQLGPWRYRARTHLLEFALLGLGVLGLLGFVLRAVGGGLTPLTGTVLLAGGLGLAAAGLALLVLRDSGRLRTRDERTWVEVGSHGRVRGLLSLLLAVVLGGGLAASLFTGHTDRGEVFWAGVTAVFLLGFLGHSLALALGILKMPRMEFDPRQIRFVDRHRTVTRTIATSHVAVIRFTARRSGDRMHFIAPEGREIGEAIVPSGCAKIVIGNALRRVQTMETHQADRRRRAST